MTVFNMTDRTGVTVSEDCPPEIEAAANLLLSKLILGGSRARTVVRLPAGEFRGLHVRQGPFQIKSELRGVLIQASLQEIRGAVLEFLRDLEYVQVIPGALWELPPKVNTKIDVDSTNFAINYTRCTFGHDLWQSRASEVNYWLEANYPSQYKRVYTQHAFGDFYRRNKAFFDVTPEARALVNGVRNKPGVAREKFCLSNNTVMNLLCKTVNVVALNNPGCHVSISPSDGGGWCECSGCVAMGTPSDRIAYFAAETKQNVGFLAYDQHMAPPTKNFDLSNCIIQVATRFDRGNDEDETVQGWLTKTGATIGSRSYGGVWQWNFDRPGKQTNVDFLPQQSYETQEINDSWLANGGIQELFTFSDLLFPESFKETHQFLVACCAPESTQSLNKMSFYLSQAYTKATTSDKERNRLKVLWTYVEYVRAVRAWIMSGKKDELEPAIEQAAITAGQFGMVHSLALAKARGLFLGPDGKTLDDRLEFMAPKGLTFDYLHRPYHEGLPPLKLNGVTSEYVRVLTEDVVDFGEGFRNYEVNGTVVITPHLLNGQKTTFRYDGSETTIDKPVTIKCNGNLQVWDQGGRTTLRFLKGATVLAKPDNIHFGRLTTYFKLESGLIGIDVTASVGTVIPPVGEAVNVPQYPELLMFGEPGVYCLKDIVGSAVPSHGRWVSL